ncbi:MAG: baseplate J/gp47 family protein [Gammaproteobacteria bacterium]|nr:baseplate J/gp47 family protein [Gammaproteobacteria bacterium]MDH5651686.1 baseplate J/gp47 family protein [Gammaproteobacteria bacterium]
MTTNIDLSQLPAPQVVEQLSFTAIRDAMLADLSIRDTGLVNLPSSDPAYKVIEVAAYRELLIRQDVNDKAVHIMLAYAVGTDLDNIGALPWMNTLRLLIDPGDPNAVPPIEPIYESDSDYRVRLQLALEGFSTAGPVDAYIYHAKSADGKVRDVSVTTQTESGTATGGSVTALDDTSQTWPVDGRVGWIVSITAGTGADQVRTVGANSATQLIPGVAWTTAPDATSVYTLHQGGSVVVTVLSTEGNGIPDAALLDTVTTALNDQYVRPLTDQVIVQAANLNTYSINAGLTVYPGPGAENVRQTAEAAVTKYAVDNQKLGRDITRAGLLGALVVDGVQNVDLVSPAEDIVNDPTQFSTAGTITVTVLGTGE